MLLLQVPPNGLVIYCGTIVTDEGKEKKVLLLELLNLMFNSFSESFPDPPAFKP